MDFSTALNLNDINDYIGPSQSCIKPIKVDKSNKTKVVKIEEDGTWTAITENGEVQSLPKANITLNDCLACSGCITTAESILIKQHSGHLFTDILVKNNSAKLEDRRILIVSLSPQSVSSLTSFFFSDLNHKDDILDCFNTWKNNIAKAILLSDIDIVRQFVVHHLELIGVNFVTDVTWARDASLYKAAEEFVQHYNATTAEGGSTDLPIFSGICPGWVCYAEKTHGGDASLHIGPTFSLVPYLSKVCSPQQIIGRLCKSQPNNNIYHVTVMPCFDKKLEASRQEFTQQSSETDEMIPDIDLVLSTNEFLEVLNSTALPVGKYVDNALSECPVLGDAIHPYVEKLTSWFRPVCKIPSPSMYRHVGSGSGGYAVTVFSLAASGLFNISLPANQPTNDGRVIVRTLHNRDMQEILLFRSEGDRTAAKDLLSRLRTSRTPYRHLRQSVPKALLVFAVANGFRNIQTVVQLLRNVFRRQQLTTSPSGASELPTVVYPFDYVEVMACPKGCLNGGGQLKNVLYDSVASHYEALPTEPVLTNCVSRQIYAELESRLSNRGSFETEYRQVPHIEIINPLALHW